MRLSLIVEGPGTALKPLYGKGRLKQYKNALSFMPAKKVQHSLRVGATVAKSGLGPDEVEAAILHDYIERGGDLSKLAEINVSPRAIRIITMLSIQEKKPGMDDTQEVQHHIEEMLDDPNIDPHDKNVAIIVKCADRIDNLRKRIREKRLEPAYAAASEMLFKTLLGAYTGDPSLTAHVRKKINKLTG
jgi:(p)ppGpp synthase/HD superfamily hydrolase